MSTPDRAALGVHPPWNPETDEVLVCRAVRPETHDVQTFVFSAPTPRRFHFEPGQYLLFEFEIAGARINRCYTIASSPTRPDRLSITVKRVPGGPVSNWLHDSLRVGMQVSAQGPMGAFTCTGVAGGRLYFSAGSGITPLMSMARNHYDLASDADIVFLHSARSPADLIFRDEIALMASRAPQFRPVAVCEQDAPQEAWNGFKGRLTAPMLGDIAADFLEREVYVCGPSAYMLAVKQLLAQAGYDMRRYHQESFDFAQLAAEARAGQPVMAAPAADSSATSLLAPAADVAPPAVAGAAFQVRFSKSERRIECSADGFVLDAARRAGLRLPSSCTKGMCGTCKSRLLSGTVQMTHAGGIRQREIDQGMILICCSRPTSDLVIER